MLQAANVLPEFLMHVNFSRTNKEGSQNDKANFGTQADDSTAFLTTNSFLQKQSLISQIEASVNDYLRRSRNITE